MLNEGIDMSLSVEEIEKQKNALLESFKRDKEELLASYWKKTNDMDNKVSDLTKKIENLTVIFNQEYVDRLAALEEKERDTREKNVLAERRNGELDRLAAQLRFREESINKSKEEALEEVNKVYERNSAILVEIEKSRRENNLILAENEVILGKIREEEESIKQAESDLQITENRVSRAKAANDLSGEDLKSSKESLKKQQDFFDASRQAFLEQKEEAERKIGELEAATALNKESVRLLEVKSEEIDLLIKQSQEIAAQNKLEAENNKQAEIAGKAREIRLNEKERSLNEREKNVKIIEQQIGGK